MPLGTVSSVLVSEKVHKIPTSPVKKKKKGLKCLPDVLRPLGSLGLSYEREGTMKGKLRGILHRRWEIRIQK